MPAECVSFSRQELTGWVKRAHGLPTHILEQEQAKELVEAANTQASLRQLLDRERRDSLPEPGVKAAAGASRKSNRVALEAVEPKLGLKVLGGVRRLEWWAGSFACFLTS